MNATKMPQDSEKGFAFLRFSLIDGAPLPQDLSPEDWQDIFAFGFCQGLYALMFRGIERLPEGVAPPQSLLMQWLAMSNNVRRHNIMVNSVAGEIYQKFADDGFRTCILKGPGNALMYDDPYSRMPGDVDLWVCGYKDEGAEGGFVYPSVKQITPMVVDYSRQNFHVDMTRGHHSSFYYKDIEVEAHFSPSERANPVHRQRMKQWFQEQAPQQCCNFVELPEDTGRIAIPTLSFNLVYQLDHIYRHLFDMGIGMRQIVDYWHLLTKCPLTKEDKELAVSTMRRLGLYEIAGAVMWVLAHTLHLDEGQMLVEPDEKRGQHLLSEILNGGNFGSFDTKYGQITKKATAGKYFTKTYRNLSFARYYPSEALTEPFYRTFRFFVHAARGWE